LIATTITHKKIVQKYYSGRASEYDGQKARTWKSEAGFECKVLEAIMKAVHEAGAGFGLDAGVGSGRVFAHLVKRMGLSAIGVDLSREMLKLARKKMDSVARTSHLLLGDIEFLPFRRGSVSLLLCISTLHYFPSSHVALMEFSRVLKKSGIFIYGDVTMHEMDTRGFMNELEKSISPAHGGYHRPSEVRSLMESHGIRVTKTKTIPYRKSFKSLNEDKTRYFNIDSQSLRKFLKGATGKERILYEIREDEMALFYTVISGVRKE